MSYNIDNWEQIAGNKLRISKENAEALRRKVEDDRPEDWFLDDLKFGPDGYADVDLHIRSMRSGYFFEDHIGEVAAALEGEADFVITWEGGDSHSGLRIAGGKAIEMDVVMTLVEKRSRR